MCVYKYIYVCMLNHFSCVWLFVIPWTAVRQAPLSMGCSRPEYWGGVPCPPPGDLHDIGIKPASLMSPALAGELPLVPPGKPVCIYTYIYTHIYVYIDIHIYLSIYRYTHIACQAPLSKGFSRQEHWGGLLCPSSIYIHICNQITLLYTCN